MREHHLADLSERVQRVAVDRVDAAAVHDQMLAARLDMLLDYLQQLLRVNQPDGRKGRADEVEGADGAAVAENFEIHTRELDLAERFVKYHEIYNLQRLIPRVT